jgi:uncharacterized glyoxalase superfamily protein PhnB
MRARIMKNRSAPGAAIVPVLVYQDVDNSVEWLCGACGFSERVRVERPNGQITHAQLEYGGCAVMLGSAGAEFMPPPRSAVSHAVLVHVDNVEAHFERVRQGGAHIVSPPTNMPFGERQYSVEDPGGHRWTFSQSVADVDPAVWGGKLAPR